MSDVRLMSKRAKKVAKYIVENKATVRQAAKEFGISKSTVHKYVTEKLWYTDRTLYFEVRGVFEYNVSQRAIRGGMATKAKYESKK